MSTKYHPHHRLSESSKCNIINIISVINSRANYTIISLPNPPNDNQIPAIETTAQIAQLLDIGNGMDIGQRLSSVKRNNNLYLVRFRNGLDKYFNEIVLWAATVGKVYANLKKQVEPHTKQLPSKQLSKQTEFSASSLIPLFITGKYNNIPNLVSILWDIYCQLKLLKLSQSKKTPPSLSLPKNYSFEHFLLCSPLGEDVNFSTKNMKLLVKGMNEYYFNHFWPIPRSSVSLINDTFLSYFKYAISISQSVNLDLCPLHLHFWIVPKGIMSKKSSDSEYFEQEDDILMNIEKRLNLGGIDFTTSTIKNGKDAFRIGISR